MSNTADVLDAIVKRHLQEATKKGKADLVIGLSFMRACKAYGYQKTFFPTRVDILKVKNLYKTISKGHPVTLQELIELFVQNWPSFNFGGPPDLSKLLLVYKKILKEEEDDAGPIRIRED